MKSICVRNCRDVMLSMITWHLPERFQSTLDIRIYPASVRFIYLCGCLQNYHIRYMEMKLICVLIFMETTSTARLWHLLERFQNMRLQWRHKERDGVSNHQPHDCLLKGCLFRPRSKKTSKLRVTGLCAGNSPVTSEFPTQKPSDAKNVSIWWRHHAIVTVGSPRKGPGMREVFHVMASSCYGIPCQSPHVHVSAIMASRTPCPNRRVNPTFIHHVLLRLWGCCCCCQRPMVTTL